MKSKQKRVRRPRHIFNDDMELLLDGSGIEALIFIDMPYQIPIKEAKRVRDWLSAAIAWAEQEKGGK